jgi:hypothetical protein
MADNVAITPGTGATVSAEDIGAGVLVQRIKLTHGIAGTATDASGNNPLPITVSNASLSVTGTFWQATQPVSGTFWQATQPVSLATNTPDVTDRAARLLGHVTVDNASLAVTGSFFQATQPVSGTFWQATQPVSGTFWQATQPISAASLPLPSGAATSAKQPALGTAGTASADVLSVQGVASMTALKVDGSAVTQPISAASLPLPTGAALDATLTGGTQRNRVTDGTNNAAVKAASTAAVAADTALVVAQSPNTYATTIARLVSAAATTNATLVKSSAGRLFKIRGYNAKAAVAYFKLYNKATAPTVGTDTPVLTIPLKASDMFDIDFGAIGLGFATGIGFGITGAVADADTTALVAADVVGLNVMYA